MSAPTAYHSGDIWSSKMLAENFVGKLARKKWENVNACKNSVTMESGGILAN